MTTSARSAADRTLEAMVAAARAGGDVAALHFRRGVTPEIKADGSPVSAADTEAERVIVERLRGEFPGHGVLGEESGAAGPSAARFIVDPVDGTRNFVRGIPFWATLLALEEDGVVTAGVVYQPMTGDVHTARRGGGAFLNGQRLAVSSVAALDRAMLVHPSLTIVRGDLWDGFVRLVDATGRQRGFGDFLCFTTVAEGRVELGLALNVKPWDLAPMRLLVEEAGGRFTDLAGVPTIASERVLASNGRVHDRALALLRGGDGVSSA